MKIHFIYDKCSTPIFYNHGPQTHLLKQFMEFKAMLDFQCYNVSVASHLLHRFSYHALPILISFSSNVLRDMMIRSFRVCLLCDLVFLTSMVVLLILQWRTIKLADVFLASRVVLRIFQWRIIKPADRWSTQVQWRTLNNPVLLLLRQ